MKKIYIIIALICIIGVLIFRVKSLKTDNIRLSDNQRALMSDIEFYKTESGKNAASVERLKLEKSEFKTYESDLVKKIEELNIKIRRLQSVSQTHTETFIPIEVTVRDSIFKTDTLKCIEFRDPWIDFSGCFNRSVFTGSILCRDTIIQVVHRVPRKLWFIRYGTKAIRQEILSQNPYNKIVYTKYIELRK